MPLALVRLQQRNGLLSAICRNNCFGLQSALALSSFSDVCLVQSQFCCAVLDFPDDFLLMLRPAIVPLRYSTNHYRCCTGTNYLEYSVGEGRLCKVPPEFEVLALHGRAGSIFFNIRLLCWRCHMQLQYDSTGSCQRRTVLTVLNLVVRRFPWPLLKHEPFLPEAAFVLLDWKSFL